MIGSFDHDPKHIDLSNPLEIGIAIQRDKSVSSFGIEGAKYATYRDGDFVGSKADGGPCNLETITFTPHGNGTHTECLGHISQENIHVNDCIVDTFYSAVLFTSPSLNKDGSLCLDNLDLQHLKKYNSLIIRSLPNLESKVNYDYSGKSAPYICVDDMHKIVQAGIEHLLIDLPSVDPEWDNGLLAAHHVFWNYPTEPRVHCSITEFIYIADHIQDGVYAVKLNVGHFISDAAPSRPVLYPYINSK